MPTLTMSVPISEQCLSDILCAAFEGGINYWVNRFDITKEPTMEHPEEYYSSYMAPAYGGEVRLISAEYGEPVPVLTQEGLLGAIARAASEGRFKLETYEGDLDASDIDAGCADVIVQYACLGEIVFG